MSFDFDFSQIPDDPTKIHQGGNRPVPGHGMVMITKWSEYTGAKGKAHELEFEIVAWNEPSSVARVHTENIFHQDTTGKGFPMKRMTALAMAAGLFNARDVAAWKAAGKAPQIDMQKLVGRPIMVELIEEKDQNDATKSYIRIGNIGLAFYHIRDPKVKDWPKNQALWNAHATTVGEWVTELKPASQPTATKKQEPAAAVAAGVDDPFGNV